MRIPLVDLSAQLETVHASVQDAVCRVIDSTQYVLGPTVDGFERAIADYLGTPHAVGMSSGSDAILATLMALGVGRGDVVVTTPYTFFATAGTVARLGARVAFVDIDPRTYNMDPDALRDWLGREGHADAVKAIIPVHLFGQCADMDPIVDAARERGIPVIEDAAQAIGARHPSRRGDRKAGTIGLAGCLSFYPSKTLGAMGDAGLVVTADAGLAERLRLLRNHGADRTYHHAIVGGNFRLDALQAAVLHAKLPHLPSWIAGRQRVASHYDARLDSGCITTPGLAWNRDCHTYHQYVIAVRDRRDALRRHLATHGIETGVYYPIPLHLQPCFWDLGYRRGDFPVSEDAAERTLALPVYPELTRGMQDEVIGRIAEFYA